MLKSKGFWVVAIILFLVIVFFATSYNGLVGKEEDVKLGWNEMQNAYQRRIDLVPNLVSVVKASSTYEKQTLQQLTEARTLATRGLSTSNIDGVNYRNMENAQAGLVNSMNRAIAIIEAYPDIKSTRSYIDLQEQLIGTERRIKFARKDFNKAVAEFNKKTRNFPSSLSARLFGFSPREGFSADPGSEVATEVKF